MSSNNFSKTLKKLKRTNKNIYNIGEKFTTHMKDKNKKKNDQWASTRFKFLLRGSNVAEMINIQPVNKNTL